MTIKAICSVVVNSGVGAAAGFLTRPCCVGPAVLSIVGVSSVGFSDLVVSHRAAFIGGGSAMLIATTWINFRREGGWFNKSLATVAAVVGFSWSVRVLGIW